MFTDLCPPDTMSSDGFESSGCVSCTNGTYQSEYGSTYCIPCSEQNKTKESFDRCFGQFFINNYYKFIIISLLFMYSATANT